MIDLRQQRQTRLGLMENINSGLAVPIVSDEAIFDLVLPGHRSLVQEYVTHQSFGGYTATRLGSTTPAGSSNSIRAPLWDDTGSLRQPILIHQFQVGFGDLLQNAVQLLATALVDDA